MKQRKRSERAAARKRPIKRQHRRRRLRLDPDERQRSLLELGQRLFGESPYDQVSMEDVAQAAKISKGLLYHYFPTKRDYYVQIVRNTVEEMTAHSEPKRELVPLERLQDSLANYLNYVKDNAAAYRRFLDSGVGVDLEVRLIVEGFRQRVVKRVVEGLELESVSPVVRVALHGWVGFVEAVSLAWLDTPGLSQRAILELCVHSLRASLVATGEAKIAEQMAAMFKSS